MMPTYGNQERNEPNGNRGEGPCINKHPKETGTYEMFHKKLAQKLELFLSQIIFSGKVGKKIEIIDIKNIFDLL